MFSFQNHKLHNFCCKHEEYVHPRYVLEHDNITLFGVTDTHAFFCVSKPDFNVYETRVSELSVFHTRQEKISKYTQYERYGTP